MSNITEEDLNQLDEKLRGLIEQRFQEVNQPILEVELLKLEKEINNKIEGKVDSVNSKIDEKIDSVQGKVEDLRKENGSVNKKVTAVLSSLLLIASAFSFFAIEDIVEKNIKKEIGEDVSTIKKEAEKKVEEVSDVLKKVDILSVPVGTIVASVTPYSKLPSNEWVPADGREIIGSKYQGLTGNQSAPDLRGVFLRGINTFDLKYENESPDNKVSDNQKDPTGLREVYNFQSDEVIKHSHSFFHGAHGGGGISNVPPNSNESVPIHRKTGAYGGEETRPKNVAVYYYIKVN